MTPLCACHGEPMLARSDRPGKYRCMVKNRRQGALYRARNPEKNREQTRARTERYYARHYADRLLAQWKRDARKRLERYQEEYDP